MKRARHSLSLFSLIFIFSAPILAQEYSKVEAYAGFQSMHEPNMSLVGFKGEMTGNLGPVFGIVGEFSFGTSSHSEEGKRDVTKEYYFLAGPRFSYRAKRLRVYGQVLAGAAHLKIDRNSAAALWSKTGLGVAAGLGIEFKLKSRLWVRPAQFDWLAAHFYNHGNGVTNPDIDWAQRMRYSAGISFRLGNIEK